MGFKNTILKKFAFILAMFCALIAEAQPSADAGKILFTNNCASCHAKNMKTALTGPALGGVESQWDSKANLYSWIRNSQGMIKQGHPRAVELWNKYKPTVMTAFPNLKDDEIASILLYVQGVYDGTYGPKKPKEDEKIEDSGNKWLIPGIIGALALLAYILSIILSNLDRLNAAREGRPYREKTWFEKLTSKGMLSFLIFAGVLIGGYTTVNRAVNLGRQKGYQPDQPIKFSHATHAGLNKIDCQYCHDGARRSKHSVIPATNTCLNCHKAVKVGSQYGTAELTKIFASAGFDPNTNKYIDNYDKMADKDIKAIYTKWIEEQYVAANKLTSVNASAKAAGESQWEDIVASLTGGVDKKIQGPIEWVRIHNLPDHAYFNHSQHVAVGKVACQTCHGEVEKMEVVAQHAPLSMGWCINCHRQTEVKFKDNAYYDSYERLHEELKSGKRDKVTVADIGGLECQKCHY
jgi:mono/diheme cytochrome c family protein